MKFFNQSYNEFSKALGTIRPDIFDGDLSSLLLQTTLRNHPEFRV
jgi:hypothetical protein